MFLASARARAGRLGPAIAFLLVAFAVQAGYLATQIVLFADDLDKFSPKDHAYGSIYFTLLGADHAHVLVAALLNAWVLVKLLGGLTRYRMNALLAATFYVHAVNVLTVVITLTIVSPAL
jgi:heme/copper-type cytochrome/quinol oxidase subunit 3